MDYVDYSTGTPKYYLDYRDFLKEKQLSQQAGSPANKPVGSPNYERRKRVFWSIVIGAPIILLVLGAVLIYVFTKGTTPAVGTAINPSDLIGDSFVVSLLRAAVFILFCSLGILLIRTFGYVMKGLEPWRAGRAAIREFVTSNNVRWCYLLIISIIATIGLAHSTPNLLSPDRNLFWVGLAPFCCLSTFIYFFVAFREEFFGTIHDAMHAAHEVYEEHHRHAMEEKAARAKSVPAAPPPQPQPSQQAAGTPRTAAASDASFFKKMFPVELASELTADVLFKGVFAAGKKIMETLKMKGARA